LVNLGIKMDTGLNNHNRMTMVIMYGQYYMTARARKTLDTHRNPKVVPASYNNENNMTTLFILY
jgi:hypothetical protein